MGITRLVPVLPQQRLSRLGAIAHGEIMQWTGCNVEHRLLPSVFFASALGEKLMGDHWVAVASSAEPAWLTDGLWRAGRQASQHRRRAGSDTLFCVESSGKHSVVPGVSMVITVDSVRLWRSEERASLWTLWLGGLIMGLVLLTASLRFSGVWLAVGVSVFLVLAGLMAQRLTQEQLILSQHALVIDKVPILSTKKTRSRTIPLSEIAALRTERHPNSPANTPIHHLVLETTGGETIPLCHAWSPESLQWFLGELKLAQERVGEATPSGACVPALLSALQQYAATR